MAELHLSLLGKPQVSLDDSPITEFTTAKTEALFYYLAVTNRPHTREVLADLLWGDMPEAKAKRNLTKSLSILRKLAEPFLLIEHQSVAFDQNASYRLDVAIFQQTLEADYPEQDLTALRQAVESYQGDFLEGFHVKDAISFEEWMMGERERLRELMLQALQILLDQYARRAEYAFAIEYAHQLLSLDPWRESAHRQLMILLAQNGQRNAALAQYEICRQVLADELGIEPTAETTNLYQRLLATAVPPPHNLPLLSDPFFGRKIELHQIATHLDNPNCCLLTIVGPGGIGKTRLALEASARYLKPETLPGISGFPGGVYFVPLAPGEVSRNSSSDQGSQILVSAIANALQISIPGTADPPGHLVGHLKEAGQVLLILDNFEHLIDSVDLIDFVLQRVPHTKLLVTSRERLNLRQEWVLEIAGLDYPGEAGRITNAVTLPARRKNFEDYSAVAMFVQRAQQVQPEFTSSDADKACVRRICQLVEGTPLAIELAASLLRTSSCTEIATGIEQSLDFLTTTLRNVPGRHRNLRAVFEHSWQTLSGKEQAVFRQLSVFRGGFQQEAAEAVAGGSLLMLRSLIDKSFVRHTPTGRYEIHELLRQYATEKLAEIPAEEEAALDRHSHYYARFLQERGRQSKGEEEAEILAELGVEADNIRAGWQRAIGPGQAVTMAEINQYWYLGRFEQAAGLYQKSLAALRPPDPSWDRGLDLHRQGFLAYQQGAYETAKQRLTESLSVLQAADDPLFRARSGVVLGMLACDMGEYAEAERLLRDSLAELEALGEHRYRSYALGYLGRIAYTLDGSRPTRIEKLLEQNLELSREVDDSWAVVHALNNLGSLRNLIAKRAVEHQATQVLLQKSVELCRETGNSWSLAVALNQLGLAALALDDDSTAETLFHEALDIAQKSRFIPLILEILVGLAALLTKQGPLSPQSQDWIVRVLVLSLNHPSAGQPIRDQAVRLLAELEKAGLPPELVAAAKERGRTMTLEAMIEDVSNTRYELM